MLEFKEITREGKNIKIGGNPGGASWVRLVYHWRASDQ